MLDIIERKGHLCEIIEAHFEKFVTTNTNDSLHNMCEKMKMYSSISVNRDSAGYENACYYNSTKYNIR